MKRRAVYFLLCVCFCFSTLFSSFLDVSAVDDNTVFYEYDEQGNVIAEYYTYHEDYDIKKGYNDTLDSDRGPMMFASSKQLYSWKPDSIDWASFPNYIRAIAYSPYSNISWPDDDGGDHPNISSYRAPFIMITSNGTNYTVRAGWDVALWYRSSTGNCTVGFNQTTYNNLNPVLYMATFKCSNNTVVTDWHEVTYDNWGTTGNFHNFSGSGMSTSDKLDVFMYGANGYVTNNAVLVSAKLTDTDSVMCAPWNKGRGILDHAYAGFPASFYNSSQSYITTFTPKAPNSYTVTESTSFGINSTILTGSNFLFHEDLPYGKDTLVIAATINDGHTYQLLTDSNADVIYLRNWNWSNTEKLRVTLISSAPIYRLGYNANNGGNVSMNSASGLTLSDMAPGYSGSDIALDKIIQYYVDKGYHFYSYSYTAGNVALTITNNSAKLNIDDSLSFPHAFAQYPNADTLNQTLLEEQNKTSKSIWDTLKDLFEKVKNLPSDIANSIKGFFDNLGDRISVFFDNLAEKIKGFFLPSEGFFDAYVGEYQNYFEDRFGLLYELPDAVIGILQQFIDYSPAESGYSITFPEVVMPVLDNGEWYDKVIIEETDITFEFLEQGAFKTLYSMYRSVVWMIFIFALINLIIRKSERVFGGSGG